MRREVYIKENAGFGGTGVVLINETPPDPDGSEAYDPCFSWRRGRIELHQPVKLAAALGGWKAVPVGHF
jgi:hypothetical protein